MTKTEAEAALRRMMLGDRPPQVGEEVTFATAVELMLRELEEIDRKPSTLANYRGKLRFRLLPLFGEIPVDRVKRSSVEALATTMLKEGKAVQTRANTLKLLSQVFNYARRQRWCQENPCWGVRRPQIRRSREIRFLDKEELDAVVEAIDISKRPFGILDRAIILTAAMTGMRQGELLALRWRDIDWKAKRIRVRRNYVRGYWGTPKSYSGQRSMPLATRVAAELQALRGQARLRAGRHLVFASPKTGRTLDHASLLRRFRKALKAAGVRRIPLPRPPPHLRHEDGSLSRGLNAPDSRVDGPPRLPHNADLCGLRTGRQRERHDRQSFLLRHPLSVRPELRPVPATLGEARSPRRSARSRGHSEPAPRRHPRPRQREVDPPASHASKCSRRQYTAIDAPCLYVVSVEPGPVH